MVYDLEERLVRFAVLITDIVESISRTRVGNHLAGQLVRCGTSPALNYGEAQSAESRNDFVHKLKIILKELRETRISLMIIERRGLSRSPEQVRDASNEVAQLVAIFAKSIRTAESKRAPH